MRPNEINDNQMPFEDALLVLEDFWQADREHQDKALETAYRCMLAITKMEGLYETGQS